ncbi:hypothetical protein [Amphiplicatus metriothermophilus]|uniref:4-coumarate--CoA ligase, photoactive yellow protein activation family n=1 Tax=Amphiplicatus metriothermophilus TaxID=1519374 RepID=A0A239PIQ6_9PROT|nr:hypothetical protein [Amphiplicatus metriothermophilus]MBB5517975.1 4-coumarate--CoA ligase (photoactive yellow protein activation family) [Amphiplicatus metriothermophilus]SNT67692.1 4-coumarate--CoA ligase, photoactive yellow protein activation family [Amphiplicatus metriothermophilus]
MKAFVIPRERIARIIAALAAEELGARFKRHVDFLTLAGWSEETPLGAGGLALSKSERAACARRAADFFGLDPVLIDAAGAERLADWARAAEDGATRSLTVMRFTPAGRDSEREACAHPADEVFADAAAAANLLYGRRRMISLVAPHGLLGFSTTVLTPNLLRIPCLDARGLSPDALGETLAFGDVLVATPTLWRYVIREGVLAPDNAMGVSFGEPMTSDLAAEMRKAGFGAIREFYGSTETGLVAWRDSPDEAFILFDCWRRDGEKMLRRSPSGAVRRVKAMDILHWESERSFRLGGRRDGAVQVGAVNVFPDRIAETISRHRFVESCEVSADGRPGGITRLIAHIRLNAEIPPTEQTAREIDAWCRTQLGSHERPRIYHFEAEPLRRDDEPSA